MKDKPKSNKNNKKNNNRSSENERNERDPDYVQLTSKELNSIANNVPRISDEMRNVLRISDEMRSERDPDYVLLTSKELNSIANNVLRISDKINRIVSVTHNVDTPSTSRTTTRKRAAQNSTSGPPTKRYKNKNAAKPPSVFETTPSATYVNPDSLVTTENEPPASLGDCPICFESLENKDISSTICGHVFCTSCITAAVKAQKSCPDCRTQLTLKKIHPLFL